MTVTGYQASSAESVQSGRPAGRVILKPRRARPFFGRHPWVMGGAVDRIEGRPETGDVVDLVTDKGEFVARGVVNLKSFIQVRLYSWDESVALDADFWRRRINSAIDLRVGLGYDDPQGGARVVFSEGDGLSGLIVDRYGSWLVVQLTSAAFAARLDLVVEVLTERFQPQGVILRIDKSIAKAEGLELTEGFIRGAAPDGPVYLVENGLKFGVDLSAGQKTGYYLDQRENRRVAAHWAKGRRVLDVCCYTGGFSLAAAKLGGAQEVLGIDSSAKALAAAQANAALNEVSNVRFEEADAFEAIDQLATQGEQFGLVVLDPPKFAGRKSDLDDALRAYHRLNRRALDLLPPGGILVTCSCSGHVIREDFGTMLSNVAARAKRDLQVIEFRGAAPDHPVSATCWESEYLKCFVCRVG